MARLHPPNLKILPVALVPQARRRGGIILDLSFSVYQEVDGVVTITQKSVNETTVLTAPAIPVKEILVIDSRDCYNFAYVLPQPAGEPLRLVIPAAVRMGWIKSPGLFCAVTESARDLTQHFVDSTVPLPPDPVDTSYESLMSLAGHALTLSPSYYRSTLMTSATGDTVVRWNPPPHHSESSNPWNTCSIPSHAHHQPCRG
jgi:hypothetical protein